MDTTNPVREQIYSAIRAFTCATIAEAEAATRAIIRLVDNALPDDGTCVRCGSAPRTGSGLCNTCVDEDADRQRPAWEQQIEAAIRVFREHGIEFSAPWHGDLDGLERERFDALSAAVAAIKEAAR